MFKSRTRTKATMRKYGVKLDLQPEAWHKWLCKSKIQLRSVSVTTLSIAFEYHKLGKTYFTQCLKNIPDIFDCNLRINYQILRIFGTNIFDTTCHQMII